jgi:hypothetical protein
MIVGSQSTRHPTMPALAAAVPAPTAATNDLLAAAHPAVRLRALGVDRLHSRKLRSFAEVAFQ